MHEFKRGAYFVKEEKPTISEFQFRYAFMNEMDDCNAVFMANDDYNFFGSDQFEFLLSNKDGVIREISNKFISKDDNIVGMTQLPVLRPN